MEHEIEKKKHNINDNNTTQAKEKVRKKIEISSKLIQTKNI